MQIQLLVGHSVPPTTARGFIANLRKNHDDVIVFHETPPNQLPGLDATLIYGNNPPEGVHEAPLTTNVAGFAAQVAEVEPPFNVHFLHCGTILLACELRSSLAGQVNVSLHAPNPESRRFLIAA